LSCLLKKLIRKNIRASRPQFIVKNCYRMVIKNCFFYGKPALGNAPLVSRIPERVLTLARPKNEPAGLQLRGWPWLGEFHG